MLRGSTSATATTRPRSPSALRSPRPCPPTPTAAKQTVSLGGVSPLPAISLRGTIVRAPAAAACPRKERRPDPAPTLPPLGVQGECATSAVDDTFRAKAAHGSPARGHAPHAPWPDRVDRTMGRELGLSAAGNAATW